MSKDVIIILAGGVNTDGSLPEQPQQRVLKGIELYRAGVAPKIIMSGKWALWLEESPAKTEAVAMKEYAVQMGVPTEDIILEEDSVDTVGNAYFTKIKILKPRGWHKVAVVTSDYHVERTRFIFEHVLGTEYKTDVIGALSTLSPEDFEAKKERENKSLTILKSWLEKLHPLTDEKVHELMSTKHPGYAQNPEISKEELSKMVGRS